MNKKQNILLEMTGEELKKILSETSISESGKLQAQYLVIDTKLDGINTHLCKLNGKVAEHEKIINERAIVVAEFLEHNAKAEGVEKRIRNLEDVQLSSASIKKWFISAIAITATTIGIITALFKVFQ